tara:strand:- start:1883 stop:2554 length:672 start_codon:yes stop_codon:yes gene_type:complete
MANYTPFQMPAKKNGNSPIEKNYGSPVHRGFTGGVGSKEMEGGVGAKFDSAFEYSDSPHKFGFLKKIRKKVQKLVGKGTDVVNKLAGVPGEEPPEETTGAEAVAEGAVEDASGGGDLEARVSALENKMGGGSDPFAKAKKRIMKPPMWGGLFSDRRLKENIKRTGVSDSGIPIYEFNYIGGSNRYSGAMAQDLLHTNAVSTHESGYYLVNYNNIDVDMRLIKN